MNHLICKNCGHRHMIMGNNFDDERCELCGGILYPENETQENEKGIIQQLVNEDEKEKTYTIQEVIEMDLINSMKDIIKIKGNKRVWKNIEKIVNPKWRLVFRSAFFKAGGKVEGAYLYNGEFWKE